MTNLEYLKQRVEEKLPIWYAVEEMRDWLARIGEPKNLPEFLADYLQKAFEKGWVMRTSLIRDLIAEVERHIYLNCQEEGKTPLNEKRGADLDRSFRSKLDEIIGPDELAEGSISGTLEWLNLHNVNRFNIYPVIGPQKVVCDFTARLREKVKAGIDHHVRVYGQLRYKKRDNFPYAVNVSDLEILPLDEELPTLEELRGIAPGATGHISAEEFIESLRDENR